MQVWEWKFGKRAEEMQLPYNSLTLIKFLEKRLKPYYDQFSEFTALEHARIPVVEML